MSQLGLSYRYSKAHIKTWCLTLGSRAPPAAMWSSDSSAPSGEDAVYSPGPDLLAALVGHPAPGLRHLPQGDAVQLTCDGKPGQPLEVAAEREEMFA